MAAFTIMWREAEIHMNQIDFEIGRLMAISARNRPMRSEQCESCRRVIEFGEVFPGIEAVARKAAQWLAIRTQMRHALRKLATMWVQVTSGTRHVPEPEHGHITEIGVASLLMTIPAGHGDMRVQQRKFRVLMLHQRKGGGPKFSHRMT